jgi:hypothetical protein
MLNMGECVWGISGGMKATARVLWCGVVDADVAATGSAGGRLLLGLLGNSQRDMRQLPLQELRIQLRGVHHVDCGPERPEDFEEVHDKHHDVRTLLHVEQHRELEAQHLFARCKQQQQPSEHVQKQNRRHTNAPWAETCHRTRPSPTSSRNTYCSPQCRMHVNQVFHNRHRSLQTLARETRVSSAIHTSHPSATTQHIPSSAKNMPQRVQSASKPNEYITKSM